MSDGAGVSGGRKTGPSGRAAVDQMVRFGDVLEALRGQAECYPAGSAFADVGAHLCGAADFLASLAQVGGLDLVPRSFTGDSA